MLTGALLFLFCVVFVEAFIRLHIVADANGLSGIARQSFAAVASDQIGDDEKERLMRRNSLKILQVTASLILKFAAIAALLGLLYYGLKALAAPLASEVAASSARPLTIAVLTAASLLYVWVRNALLR